MKKRSDPVWPSLVALLGGLAVSACDTPAGTTGSAPAATSASQQQGSASPQPAYLVNLKPGNTLGQPIPGSTGPCGEFTKKMCTRVGKDSPLCKSTGDGVRMLSPKACSIALERFAQTESKIDGLGAKCVQFRDKVCKELGEASVVCKRVREKFDQFPKDTCGAIMHDYATVVEGLKVPGGQ